MLALLVSYFLVFYFLIPSRIFRLSGLFLKLKKFQRTQIEEISFAFLFAFVPFWATIALSFWFFSSHSPAFTFASWRDYHDFLGAAYSEAVFEQSTANFWRSLPDLVTAQVFFLAPYYSLCLTETFIFVFLVKRWGVWQGWRRRLVGILLGNISQWDMILTDFNFPKSEQRLAVADVLVVEDHLYQGFVKDYFLDAEGELSGLFLSSPYRFNRRRYEAAKQTDPDASPQDFWTRIPGENLYVPKDKILNLNVWYPLSTISLPSRASRDIGIAAASEQLSREGLNYAIEPVAPDDAEPIPPDEGEKS